MFYLHFTITKESYIQIFYIVHIDTNVSVAQKGGSFNYLRAFKGFTEVKKVTVHTALAVNNHSKSSPFFLPQKKMKA